MNLYYHKNKERIKAYQLKYYQLNRERYRIYNRNYFINVIKPKLKKQRDERLKLLEIKKKLAEEKSALEPIKKKVSFKLPVRRKKAKAKAKEKKDREFEITDDRFKIFFD